MKQGALKMRYPGGDPENGRAYMQRWTGTEWECAFHKPQYNPDDGYVECFHCGLPIMSAKQVDAVIAKTNKRRK